MHKTLIATGCCWALWGACTWSTSLAAPPLVPGERGLPQVSLGQPQATGPVSAPRPSIDPSRLPASRVVDLALPPELLQAAEAVPPADIAPPHSGAPAVAELPVVGGPSGPWPQQQQQQQQPMVAPGSAAAIPTNSAATDSAATDSAATNSEAASSAVGGPTFYLPAQHSPPPVIDARARPAAYDPAAFSPPPQVMLADDPYAGLSPYRNKRPVPVQRPWVEWWRPLYTGGIYPPAKEWFGRYNPVMPHFMVYGDFRSGVGLNHNVAGETDNWAQRLNLDMDLELTATERIHAFMGPLDRAGDFTRVDFTDGVDFINRTDLRLDNLFFEGDAGAIWGGLTDQDAPFDLPLSFGLMPVFYQNGVWAADNVLGAAFAIPARNSPALNWSNYDATFFWASDQIDSDAFAGDNNAAEFFGTAWFIEAYDGYIEADYAFVHDDVGGQRSYHNASLAFTRRYFSRISNAVRVIANFGQDLPREQRTADGHLVLIENSLISRAPNTVVPYFNMFYGQGRTQSLARAGVAGGILNNTGINFETDGLTGYPTLDATGVNASGGAVGINILGADFQHQLILEFAALAAHGQPQFRQAPGDQYALGMRYQKPLSHAWLFRTDHMLGFRENADDLRGSRFEFRWKF